MAHSGRRDSAGRETNCSAVACEKCYFASIDGSEAVDSAVFCALLKKRGWQDLLFTFLKKKDANDPRRLLDPSHPFLPICLHVRDEKTVAVVSPGGRDALGQDQFWKEYHGTEPTDDKEGKYTWWPGRTTYGRHTAAELSARYMQQFILCPQVEVIPGDSPEDSAVGSLLEGTPEPSADTYAADLLYVSSHGWLGGFARGFTIPAWPSAQPAQATGRFNPAHVYFSVGEYARKEHGFRGPKWIVLAQCSTLCSATWPLWAKVLAKSLPHVRGILGYEEASPNARDAAGIARLFFVYLDQNKSFLEAWKLANAHLDWAAIVHKDAQCDSLCNFAELSALQSVATTATVANYKGFTKSDSAGTDILDISPPFDLKLEHQVNSRYLQVTSANLAYYEARYVPGEFYRLTVTKPRGQSIATVKVRWVHIRPSHPYKPTIDKLFSSVTSLNASAPIVEGSKELTITPNTGNQSSVMIEMTASRPPNSHLEAGHSYLWPHVELTTSAGTVQHDFMTTGLSYG